MSAAGPGNDTLLTDSGIQWGNLLRMVFGGAVLAYFSGIVSVILGIFDIPIALLSGLASFGGEVVAVLAGLPVVIVESGFAAAVPFVVDSGPAGFVVAVAIVLVTLFVVAEVVSRVG
jgi:hypothetical protein